MRVTLRNETTGDVKLQKVGWSWTCFFFSEIFGIPLFLRGLHAWGALMVVLSLVDILLSDLPLEQELLVSVALFLLNSALATFFGAKANELAGRRYLETGWEFAEPSSAEAKRARLKWGLGLPADQRTGAMMAADDDDPGDAAR